jgi:hypothetical protein
MNLMKPIINNKLTILIIIFLCICFFLQTYFEIERFGEEHTPEKNSIRIDKLSDNITDNKEMITITQLKQSIDTMYKELNNKIENNKNTSSEITKRLDEAEKEIKDALTPTNV